MTDYDVLKLHQEEIRASLAEYGREAVNIARRFRPDLTDGKTDAQLGEDLLLRRWVISCIVAPGAHDVWTQRWISAVCLGVDVAYGVYPSTRARCHPFVDAPTDAHFAVVQWR